MTDSAEHAARPAGKLLLVDDEPNILAALRRLLRQDGYAITAETDARVALTRLESEDFDVIVSDQRMPEMTGVEFLRRAKQLRPHSMRIVLSGYTDLDSVTSAINEGAIYKFLTKPWDDGQLRDHIATALRHKYLEDDNRRMSDELRLVNARQQELNAQLAALVHEQRNSLFRDETVLQTLQEVLRQIPVPILGCGDDEMIVFCNEAAEQLFHQGQGAQPLLGAGLADVWPGGAGGSTAPWTRSGVPLGGRNMRVECRALGQGGRPRGSLFLFFEEPSS